MASKKFKAQVEKDTDSGIYAGLISNIPGGFAEGKTLKDLEKSLRTIIETHLADSGKTTKFSLELDIQE